MEAKKSNLFDSLEEKSLLERVEALNNEDSKMILCLLARFMDVKEDKTIDYRELLDNLLVVYSREGLPHRVTWKWGSK